MQPVAWRWRLDADANAPYDARHLALVALRQAGWSTPADLPVVMSEVVTNAVVHACGPIDITMTAEGEELLVEVRDAEPAHLPVLRAKTIGSLAGYGLHIVQRCTTSWGCSPPDAFGKTVWFLMALPPGERPPS